ncbi:MAG: ribonuclease E activity regulator RraA, partial [Gammaproteobacteria bacterium]|nr:ribonuclease E activity regulator RraA [Gammaproteobacteria bacterium]
DETIQTLTADLCDGYDDAGVVAARFTQYGGLRSCLGPVEIIVTDDDNSLVSSTLKEAGLGRILLVDNSGSRNCAMVGGDLARAAHENGWQGIVVNGPIRDVVELEQVPIAIYALYSCPRKSEKRGLGARGQGTCFVNVTVSPEDIAAADADGVIIIPSAVFKGLL